MSSRRNLVKWTDKRRARPWLIQQRGDTHERRPGGSETIIFKRKDIYLRLSMRNGQMATWYLAWQVYIFLKRRTSTKLELSGCTYSIFIIVWSRQICEYFRVILFLYNFKPQMRRLMPEKPEQCEGVLFFILTVQSQWRICCQAKEFKKWIGRRIHNLTATARASQRCCPSTMSSLSFSSVPDWINRQPIN